MNTCKLAWSVSAVLFIALATVGYKYVGHSPNSTLNDIDDERQALILTAAERDFVLAEMRLFLSSVQAITNGVSKENLPVIIKAARKAGVQAQPPTPSSLANKLPVMFKKLGRDTHKKFDLLALDAEELGDTQYSLQQLSELMNNCVRCHANYKIRTKF